MPHLVMEYSNSAEERMSIDGLLEDLHQALIDSELFSINDVKSRAIRIHSWLIGDKGNSGDFIHVTVELLAGRTKEQKQRLTQTLIVILSEQASHIESLTVNIRDMEKETFQKIK